MENNERRKSLFGLQRHIVGFFVLVFISAGGAFLFPYCAHADITTGLVGYYKFDDGSGTTVTDSVGGYNGYKGGASLWVTGQSNKAISFVGTGNYVDYAMLGNNPAFSPGTGNLSISFWFKTSTDFTGGGRDLYQDNTDGSGGNASDIEIGISAGNLIFGYIRDHDYHVVTMASTSMLNNGVWHHVVLERNGTTGYLYIDNGTPVTNTNALLATVSTGATNEPSVGAQRTLSVSFTGSIDDVRIYSRALSSGEVTELYNSGLSPYVTAQAASNVTNTTATLNGTIVTDGGLASTTDRGFYYGTTVSYGSTSSTTGTFNLGSYTNNISGLACNATYHFAAFSTNTYGTGTSTDSTFLTSACSGIPTSVMTLPVDGSTVGNTILLGDNAGGDYPVTSVQFRFASDSSNIGTAVTSAPYNLAWDTTTVPDGSYSIVAVATNSLGVSATSTALTITVDNSNHWYSAFTPLHQYYVSPTGTGDGSSTSSPMSLNAATSSAIAGDEYWLMAGIYPIGQAYLTRAGTASHPIVYRAMPDQHVAIRGTFLVTGAYNWIWGLDISDPDGLSTDKSDGINVQAAGVHAINNVIHDLMGATLLTPDASEGGVDGIGAWNDGAGQVFYGNIIYSGTETPLQQRGHLIYSHNDYSLYGYKYFVNNMLIDPPTEGCNLILNGGGQVTAAADCYAFHGYSHNDPTQGFYLRNNIIANGLGTLLGGSAGPADHEIVRNNYFYSNAISESTIILLGYTKQSQVEFTGNYVGGMGNMIDLNFWGAGEVNNTQYAPNVFTGNQFYSNSTSAFSIGTLAYTSSGKQERVPALQKSDIIDNNIYSNFVYHWLYANNVSGGHPSLSSWQTATAAAGNAFDLNSQVVSFPPADKVAVIPNEYESGRGSIVIYNWSSSSNINVDLSSTVSVGMAYSIYSAKDLWGTPIKSGVYTGTPVSIPTGGAQFITLQVFSSPATIPATPTSVSATPGNHQVIVTFTAGSNGGSPILYYLASSTPGNFIATSTGSPIVVSGLTNGTSYTFTVTATNAQGTSTASAPSSAVTPASDTTPPGLSGGSPSGAQSADTTQVTLSLTTDEAATCRYSTTANTAYDSMTGNFTTTGNTSHSTLVTGLSNGTSYTYYVRCIDTSNNPNTSDYPISFSISSPASSGGGGGSYSSGGGSAYIPPVPIATTTATTTCASVMYPIITKQLSLGMTGNDIVLLQKILSLERLFTASSTSGTYGPQTMAGVSSFQKKNNIVIYGTPSTTGFGNVGPKTRTFINQYISQGKYPSLGQCVTSAPVLNASTTTVGSYIFTRSLTLGSTGSDVKALQVFLNDHGFTISSTGAGSPGNETTYFGNATKTSLIKFQEYYAKDVLAPNGLARGTGFFGASTMNKVNAMMK